MEAPHPRDIAGTTIQMADAGHDEMPRTIAFQPTPIDTMVTYYRTRDEVVTTINREWCDGDCGPNGNCTRCFVCVARNNKCQMSIGADIHRNDAPDYSPRSVGAFFEPR